MYMAVVDLALARTTVCSHFGALLA